MVELQICLCTVYVLISPYVYTCVASVISGMWSGRLVACISYLSVYIYMSALLQVKWCLGADRKNSDRHGGAFIKGSMASVLPHTAPSG